MFVSNVQLSVRFVNARSLLCKQAFGGADVIVLDTTAKPGDMIIVSGELWPVVDTDKDGSPKSFKMGKTTNYVANLMIRPSTPPTTELAQHVAEANGDEPQNF